MIQRIRDCSKKLTSISYDLHIRSSEMMDLQSVASYLEDVCDELAELLDKLADALKGLGRE